MARIYLDTHIWNISCDQGIQPEVLLQRLDEEGATLVIGQHAIDELSRTFWKPESHQRAKELFSHLDAYLNAGLRCVVKDVPETLKAEMWALRGVENSNKFLDSEDVSKIRNLVTQFARGELIEGCLDQLLFRNSQAREERAKTAANLLRQPELKAELSRVDELELRAWLEEQLKSSTATRLLVEKLRSLFPTVSTVELFEYASALISNGSRLATATLRADFYYNWRCAQRGSNPKDLIDDIYHVLNAAYCDVYAIEERKQLQYTRLILHSTRTALYDRNVQLLDQWLINIAKRERH